MYYKGEVLYTECHYCFVCYYKRTTNSGGLETKPLHDATCALALDKQCEDDTTAYASIDSLWLLQLKQRHWSSNC